MSINLRRLIKVFEPGRTDPLPQPYEQTFHLLFDSAPDAMAVADSAGGIILANPQMNSLFGYNGDELLGQPVELLIPERFRLRHLDHRHEFQAAPQTREMGVGLELSGRHKGGSEIPVEVSLSPIRIEDRVLVCMWIRDLRQRKRAEVTRAFLMSIVQSSDDCIIGVGLDGVILSWNRGAEHLFGYAAGDAVGQDITMLLPPDRNLEYSDAVERISRDERIERFETVRIKQDGTPMEVSVIKSPVKDLRGGLLGISAIYRDISKRKAAEAELLRAKNAAEAATRLKSEFLSNISHEIRTPMQGILGMTEILMDSGLDADQRECLDTVKTSGELLLTIINDILDLSKIEAGKSQLRRERFSPRACVGAARRQLEVQARAKNLTLVCDVQPEVPAELLGDSGRLMQILINLIANAIKFTAVGGVTVEVEVLPETMGTLQFSVRDTGIGIPKDKQEMIFDSFTQVDGSLTREFGGTGLGLAIAAQLVNLMDGKIWVESEEGRGSTFHFTVFLEAVSAASNCSYND